MKSIVKYEQTTVLNVPPEVFQKNKIVTGDFYNIYRAQYKMLRTQILKRMVTNNWNTLAITSPGPSEGKTLTAINLAISVARGVNQNVMLVDFDLMRPSVARYFNIFPKYELKDYFENDIPLSQVLINPGIERLVILPTTVPIEDSSELLSSPQALLLIHEIKKRYQDRYIIFDLPPMLAADDALTFSSYTDALLLVVEINKTSREDLKKTLTMLQGVNVIGIMPNKSSESMTSYYYGYGNS